MNYFRNAISKQFYAVSAMVACLRDAVVERLKIVYQTAYVLY